jgi:hypothetical protein
MMLGLHHYLIFAHLVFSLVVVLLLLLKIARLGSIDYIPTC